MNSAGYGVSAREVVFILVSSSCLAVTASDGSCFYFLSHFDDSGIRNYDKGTGLSELET